MMLGSGTDPLEPPPPHTAVHDLHETRSAVSRTSHNEARAATRANQLTPVTTAHTNKKLSFAKNILY